MTTQLKFPTYWRKLKQRLKDEGNETVTNCHQLKFKAPDGKMLPNGIAPNSRKGESEMLIVKMLNGGLRVIVSLLFVGYPEIRFENFENFAKNF